MCFFRLQTVDTHSFHKHLTLDKSKACTQYRLMIEGKKGKKINISAGKRIVESKVNLMSDCPLAKIKVRTHLALPFLPWPCSPLRRRLYLTRCSFHGCVYRSDYGANLIRSRGEGEWEMRSLMKENESERAKLEGSWERGGLRECKQITWNSAVSDWFKWEMLSVRREGWEAALSVPVGDALRMCFPRLLFISLIYLYISRWASPLAEPPQPGLDLFVLFFLVSSLSSSRGFPPHALWLAAINQDLRCAPLLQWAPCGAPQHCVGIRPSAVDSQFESYKWDMMPLPPLHKPSDNAYNK